jgi:hypothetical protein
MNVKVSLAHHSISSDEATGGHVVGGTEVYTCIGKVIIKMRNLLWWTGGKTMPFPGNES